MPQRSGETLREEASADLVWDETVDTMLEDAEIRLLFPSPFVLMLKRGVRGCPVNSQVSQGRQEAGGGAAPVTCKTIAFLRLWNAGISHVLRGPSGAAPVIYTGFASSVL